MAGGSSSKSLKTLFLPIEKATSTTVSKRGAVGDIMFYKRAYLVFAWNSFKGTKVSKSEK